MWKIPEIHLPVSRRHQKTAIDQYITDIDAQQHGCMKILFSSLEKIVALADTCIDVIALEFCKVFDLQYLYNINIVNWTD